MPINISLKSHQFMSLCHVPYDFSRPSRSRSVNRAKEASADDSMPPRLKKVANRILVSVLSHRASAMLALVDPDNRLAFAKLVGTRDFDGRHEVQQGASGPL
jgi:hypothetical protein